MRTYKGYLIDLDGTTYFGKQRIPTAEQFIHQLIERHIPFLFVTNNATRTPQEVAEILKTEYDLPVTEEFVYTSSLALIDYLKEHYAGASVYLVAEESLNRFLKSAGINVVQQPTADVVVQALDRHATYDSLAMAANCIRNGADFLVTNTDRSIPTEKGIMPSSGAITAFLSYTTGVEPIVMGKPYAPIVQGSLKRLQLLPEEVLVIGDNYETDIRSGIDHGIDTLLVLTGVTQAKDISCLPKKPTYVLEDLSQWHLKEV